MNPLRILARGPAFTSRLLVDCSKRDLSELIELGWATASPAGGKGEIWTLTPDGRRQIPTRTANVRAIPIALNHGAPINRLARKSGLLPSQVWKILRNGVERNEVVQDGDIWRLTEAGRQRLILETKKRFRGYQAKFRAKLPNEKNRLILQALAIGKHTASSLTETTGLGLRAVRLRLSGLLRNGAVRETVSGWEITDDGRELAQVLRRNSIKAELI